MAQHLSAYIAETTPAPFVWGELDCCLWACRWIERRRGVDPAAGLRGRYASKAGAFEIMALEGGMRALAGALARKAGLEETSEPVRGDVGLLALPNGPALGIKLRADQWAVKGHRRIVVDTWPCELAWSV